MSPHPAWNPTEPYQSLPALPPEQEVETPAVLKELVSARASLAAMEQAARRLPNPEILLSTLTVIEAQASSEIENVVTTTDDLFRHMESESGASPETKEALRYRTGLFEGLSLVRRRGTITRTTAETICTALAGHSMSLRSGSGTIIASTKTRQPIYTPPTGRETLDQMMGEWENYVNTPRDHDPLVRMALAHYQFEAIHPFEDGNGRTGRILNILQLINDGLLTSPVLYLSRYIIANKDEYYALLRKVTSDDDFESWVRYMLTAVQQTAESTLQLIDTLQTLEEELKEIITASVPSGGNLALITSLMSRPYTRVTSLARDCSIARPTATNWLNALVDARALTKMKSGRDVLYINERYLHILSNA